MPSGMRTVKPVLPSELALHDGLAYALWAPERSPARGVVVVLHGAGSVKENHYDFARAARAAGFGVLMFDQRGHGESAAPMDGRAIEDVATMAGLARARFGEEIPVALRGSSMGGYLVIAAARPARAAAVVAVCPASGSGLARGVASGELGFDADRDALQGLISSHDLHATVAELAIPLLLLHAEGDEVVPVEHSRELAQRMTHPGSRLVAVPGGHHRSVQHDPELIALTLRFLDRQLPDG